jgi:hypothetical protein
MSRHRSAMACPVYIQQRTYLVTAGMAVECRYCSLIPGLDVKLSTTFLAGPTVLSAVGACPPHDGVRRRWWINVESAVALSSARPEGATPLASPYSAPPRSPSDCNCCTSSLADSEYLALFDGLSDATAVPDARYQARDREQEQLTSHLPARPVTRRYRSYFYETLATCT